MYSINELSELISGHIKANPFSEKPGDLFAPVDYIMSLGGKRIRPVMCLAAYNLYHDDVSYAMDASMALEVFHNFSLMHDDLMDEADIRRGKPSVHKAYDDNTAILSGDAMLILSYQLFESYEEEFRELFQLYNKTAMEVCLGQRMDIDFETSKNVEIDDYLKMIALKTSVLIACALKMGAILAKASSQDAFHLYEFGKNTGIAFQIQDDILDTYGEQAKVGKKIGGDILQRKKTYLYLKALELLSQNEKEELESLFDKNSGVEGDALISRVMDLFNTAHVDVHAHELKLVYQQLAMSHLDAVNIDEEKKSILRDLAQQLLERKY